MISSSVRSIPRCGARTTRPNVISRPFAIRTFRFSATPAAGFTIIVPGLRADWETVFYEATRLDKAVEIDAYPDRQDLNVSLLKIAKRCGSRISMGTDAHHPWQFEFIDLALAAALAAKIPPERIVNFMPLKELRAWVEKVRGAEARRTRTKTKR